MWHIFRMSLIGGGSPLVYTPLMQLSSSAPLTPSAYTNSIIAKSARRGDRAAFEEKSDR